MTSEENRADEGIYVPEYEPGKILVCFHTKNLKNPEAFMRGFGDYLGYDFIEEWRWSSIDSIGVYKTEIGKEDDVMAFLKSYSSFVSWTDRIDSKFERRTDSIEDVIEDLRELDDNVEIPDKAYNQKLDVISEKIKKLYD
ncbi:MAG: hypothetical protein ACOCUR_02350 [Nanoarchaeota archaeon]